MSVYSSLFKNCAKRRLKAWECPSFIFAMMGITTIVVMLITFLVSRIFFTVEVVTLMEVAVTVIFIIMSYTVSNGVKRLSEAKFAAEEEKAKTDSIIENMADGLILLDSKCRISLMNPQAEKYLGIKENRIQGFCVNDKPRDSRHKTILRVCHWCPKHSGKIDNKVYKEEFEIFYPSRRYLQILTSVARNSRGRLVGYVKILHDITREKELDEIKSDFISVASHQLKTPLSTVRWALELMLKLDPDKLSGKQREMLNNAFEANQEMIHLVSDLLNVSRIEQGKANPVLERGSLKDMTKQTVEKFALLAEKKNIILEAELPDQDIKSFFDPSAVSMIVSNFVDNAVKYTPGHGKVSVSLNFVPSENPTKAVINVKDTGIGIPQDDQAKLFTKFQRGKNVLTQSTKGSGLGLYIANNIAHMHGGDISFASQVDRGTTFCLTLPLILTKNK